LNSAVRQRTKRRCGRADVSKPPRDRSMASITTSKNFLSHNHTSIFNYFINHFFSKLDYFFSKGNKNSIF